MKASRKVSEKRRQKTKTADSVKKTRKEGETENYKLVTSRRKDEKRFPPSRNKTLFDQIC